MSGGNAVHVVGTFKHLGSDADFKVNKPSQHLVLDWCLIAVNDFTGDTIYLMDVSKDLGMLSDKSCEQSVVLHKELDNLRYSLKTRRNYDENVKCSCMRIIFNILSIY